jgi:hypothetical protein
MNVALRNNTEAFLFALAFFSSCIVFWEGVNWICLSFDRNKCEFGRFGGRGWEKDKLSEGLAAKK